jgi:hypothetical protein
MLLQAHAEKRVFTVIVVDSRPMLEGPSQVSRALRSFDSYYHRQKVVACPLVRWDTVHLLPPVSARIRHLSSHQDLRRCTQSSRERRRVKSRRDRCSRNARSSLPNPVSHSMRDVQVHARRAAGQLLHERAGTCPAQVGGYGEPGAVESAVRSDAPELCYGRGDGGGDYPAQLARLDSVLPGSVAGLEMYLLLYQTHRVIASGTLCGMQVVFSACSFATSLRSNPPYLPLHRSGQLCELHLNASIPDPRCRTT